MNLIQRLRGRDWRQECTTAEIARAQAEAKLAVLEPMVEQLRTERNELQDRLLAIFNLRPIHKKTASPSSADLEPIKPATNIRNWTAMAQAAEDMAFQKERTQELQEAYRELNQPSKGQNS